MERLHTAGKKAAARLSITNTGDEPAHLAPEALDPFEDDRFPQVAYEGAYVLEPGDTIEWQVAPGDELYGDGELEVEEIDPAERDETQEA